MRADDRRRVPGSGWLAYLEGNDPGYPERALRHDFATVRETMTRKNVPRWLQVDPQALSGQVLSAPGREDIEINVCKEKKLSNMRSKASDAAILLAPPKIMSRVASGVSPNGESTK